MESKKNYSPKIFSKEEIKTIMTDIDNKLFEFIKSGKYQDVLLMMGNLGKYSLTNQLYILLQNPEATTVKGMKQWNYLGRSIIPGSKSIRIFAPIVETIQQEVKDKDGNLLLDEAGNPIVNSKQIVRKYKASYVFDISQTNGKELEIFKFNELTPVDKKETIMQGLLNVVYKQGYSFRYASEEELGKGCEGMCKYNPKEILVKDGMSDLQTISVLVHECGHALAHGPYRESFEGLKQLPSRDIREVEAESIACVVCSYLGLETTNYNFSYISGWANGDIEKFRKNMDVISECSIKLINGIEDEMIKDRTKVPKIEHLQAFEPMKVKEGELYL